MKRRRLFGALCAVSVLALMSWLIAVSSSEAEPPTPPELSTAELEHAQLPLLDITEAFEGFLADNPELKKSSYSGMSLSPEHGLVTIYWVGDVQQKVNLFIENLRSDHKSRIEVEAAKYTEVELIAAAEELAEFDNGVVSVSVDPAGGGLIVALASEEQLQRYESRRPVNPMVLRYEVGSAAEPLAPR